MYIHVRVYAGAGKEKFLETKPGYFEVQVKEPAEGNRANKRVIELVREHFLGHFSAQAQARFMVRLTSGHHSPSKIFAVEHIEND
ncbi:MAG: DUF167 domain-containing protein [Candidatus Pacebacteria bacterium]|nr:DUF167 domain-containing protein [Candidatus Paceibacterota bacterium]